MSVAGDSDREAAVEAEVLRRLEPSAQERRDMAAAVESLVAEAQAALEATGIPGEATVQGSIAKGTWLAGDTDVDIFLLIDPSIDEKRLPEAARAVAAAVLEEPAERYAQHPYVVGRYRALHVDVVPAYRVATASHRMSAVDRTPFHTAWAAQQMDAEARRQVRLCKAWCKGVDVYGADTARAGFSGYLVEVLVVSLGSFAGFVQWLAAGATPRRFSMGADEVEDPSPLVVVDPVDPGRNCAAAVSEETLHRATEAARAYLREPHARFFFPPPPRSEDGATLRARLKQRGEAWLGLWLPEAAVRLDIVFPQFQKALARITTALQAEGFHAIASDAWTDGSSVGLQWRLAGQPLPAARIHRGPPAGSPHAQRFTDKWQGHPDAVSPVQADQGRLQVAVAVAHRTPDAWLAAHLQDLPLGRHVEAAVTQARVLRDPGEVLSPWSPRVADFILERRPWER